MPDIKLYVNGRVYGGWKQATVTRSLDAISGKFDLQVTDKWETSAKPWQIFPGDACQLKINNVPLITGFVDKASPSYDDKSHGIQIAGRDKTMDLVDCSAIVPSNEIVGLKLEGIIATLAKPFGIKCMVAPGVDTGAAFPVFAIQPGETVWEAIDRATRMRFMVATTDGLGNAIVADIGDTRATDQLVLGVNIKAASADYDYSQRYSVYIVKGQAAVQGDGWDPPVAAVESQATDPNIKRYRPKIINAEMQVSDGSAGNRADLEAATRAGRSTKITVTVQGWMMSDGNLWPLNAFVRVKDPYLSMDGDMLISQVKFNVSDQTGITTELELTRPDAYLLGQGKAAKKNLKEKKKGLGLDPWNTIGASSD